MDNLWIDKQAEACKNELELRVYTSNLLGDNDELVLHGGGNTSVKSRVNGEDVLYVKGSGWDLATIKPEGLAGVYLDTLLDMAKQEDLSDAQMVQQQREAMVDDNAQILL